MGYIYRIKNTITGRCYIGLTTRSVECRWDEHVGSAAIDTKGVLYDAIRKHGKDAFEISILEQHESLEDLCKAEIRLIAEHKTHASLGGYNLTIGGDGVVGHTGWHHTDEAKAAISAGNTGKKRTVVMKQKTSELTKIAMDNPAIKKKCGNSMRGKKHKPESNEKRSASLERAWADGRFKERSNNGGRPGFKIACIDDAGNIIESFPSIKQTQSKGYIHSRIRKVLDKNIECYGYRWIRT